MSNLKTLENVGIGLSETGDIMIEENMFEVIVMRTIGVKDSEIGLIDYYETDDYGEVDLDSTFYCDYAADNGLLNLGCWIRDSNFVFYIDNYDFENKLKKSNKKLYDIINEEIEKNLD